MLQSVQRGDERAQPRPPAAGCGPPSTDIAAVPRRRQDETQAEVLCPRLLSQSGYQRAEVTNVLLSTPVLRHGWSPGCGTQPRTGLLLTPARDQPRHSAGSRLDTIEAELGHGGILCLVAVWSLCSASVLHKTSGITNVLQIRAGPASSPPRTCPTQQPVGKPGFLLYHQLSRTARGLGGCPEIAQQGCTTELFGVW